MFQRTKHPKQLQVTLLVQELQASLSLTILLLMILQR